MKMRKGAIPEGPGWLFEEINAEKISWTVCYKKTENSWAEVKIVANTPAPYKGNFYASWNGERFTQCRDAKILIEQHVELHVAVIRLLDGLKEEIFLGKKGGNSAPANRGEDRVAALLAERAPELYAALIKELDEPKVGKPTPTKKPLELRQTVKEYLTERNDMTPDEREEGVPHTNLGSIGEFMNLERDLLVYDIPDRPDYLEVRMTSDKERRSSKVSFWARTVEGLLVCEGNLVEAIKRNTPEVWEKVEELLRTYFLEKSFN